MKIELTKAELFMLIEALAAVGWTDRAAKELMTKLQVTRMPP